MVKIFGRYGNSQVQYLRLFNTRNQDKYENVYTYSLKLRELAAKAIPNNPDADQMVLNQFIVGLKNRDLKTKLMTEEIRTLEEAVKERSDWNLFLQIKETTILINQGVLIKQVVILIRMGQVKRLDTISPDREVTRRSIINKRYSQR